MPQKVSDSISNLNDQIANVAKILGRSPQRKAVFESIYNGKKKIKDKTEISMATRLPEKRVVEEGKKLTSNDIVEQTKVNGKTAYKKIDFIAHHKTKIIKLSNNPSRLKKFPTKINPISKSEGINVIKIPLPSKSYKIKLLTIDDIDDFKKARKITSNKNYTPLYEKEFKELIKKIIKEKGQFTDWGGENNDLYTTKIKVNNKRLLTVFAFKGKGKKGILKPSMMGKNGDQILRLFQSEADLFVLQYWAQVDQSVFDTMALFATAKSAMTNRNVYYCIIDGDDSTRIIEAYTQ